MFLYVTICIHIKLNMNSHWCLYLSAIMSIIFYRKKKETQKCPSEDINYTVKIHTVEH